MILNLNKIFFSITLLFGIYFFYIQYEILIKKTENYNKKYSAKEAVETFETTKLVKLDNKKIEKEKLNNKLISKSNFTKVEITILQGDTFLSILKNFNFSERRIFEIINEIEKVFNLKKLKANEKIVFYKNDNNEIKKIEFYINIDKVLKINLDNNITVDINKLKKSYYQESKEFSITESLYSDGIRNNLPQDILIKLIKLFSFDLDFQRDIKEKTLVSVSYEFNQINENNRIEYKDINYALISIEGKKLEYFKFLTDEGFIDYFNREGKNVKKSILKTPLDGAKISSNYGMRKHPISGYNKMHKGVDFAAPTGTPIYAGGNGIIEFVGNNGGYGKYIRIRHNNEYKTAYAHLSAYKKGITKGVRVNQGDVIGYVGSTGRSTGPHLHYEIIFQNKQINPMKLKLPSGKTLKGNELEKFKKEFKRIYANHLNLLYE